MTNNLGAPRITASQASKYATANDALGALDAAITETRTILVSTTSPIVLLAAEIYAGVLFRLAQSSPPPAGGFTIVIPAIERGLIAIENHTGQTASIETAYSPATTPISLPTGETAVVLVTDQGLYSVAQSGGGTVELPSYTLGTLPSHAAGLSVWLTDIERVAVSSGAAWRIQAAEADIITTTGRQLAIGDYGDWLRSTSGADQDFEIPLDSTLDFPINTQVTLQRVGSGRLTVSHMSGVTLEYDSVNFLPEVRNQGDVIGLKKVAANTWSLFGAIAPV